MSTTEATALYQSLLAAARKAGVKSDFRLRHKAGELHVRVLDIDYAETKAVAARVTAYLTAKGLRPLGESTTVRVYTGNHPSGYRRDVRFVA